MTASSNNKVFTVSELTYAIKSLLEPSFRSISLQGEISNFKQQTSGHLYFSLKDSQAQISAVMFKPNAIHLQKIPQDGDQVLLRGELSIYPPRGNYQLIVRELTFSGTGELLLKFQALKEKLKAKGWFDKKKKTLPKIPKIIGIITSPTGAAIQDIINILNRRFSNIELLVYPVKVQGEGAAKEIAKAIDDCNHYRLADVLIVGRGGGSVEDLWAFNEEIVAEAIFHSQIPIISAVGHETDYCIADFVADLRAPTPSAAAEIVIEEKEHLQTQLKTHQKHVSKILSHKISHYKNLLQTFQRHPIFYSSYALLGQKIQQIDDIKSFLFQFIRYELEKKKNKIQAIEKHSRKYNPRIQVALFSVKLKNIIRSLDYAWRNFLKRNLEICIPANLHKKFLEAWNLFLKQKKRDLILFSEHLYAINPNHLLKKGYSILFSEKEDSIILSTKEVSTGQKIVVRLHDGKLKTKVEDIER